MFVRDLLDDLAGDVSDDRRRYAYETLDEAFAAERGRADRLEQALGVYLAALRNCLAALPSAVDDREWDEDDYEVLNALRMQAELNIGCLDPEEDELAAAILVLAAVSVCADSRKEERPS